MCFDKLSREGGKKYSFVQIEQQQKKVFHEV